MESAKTPVSSSSPALEWKEGEHRTISHTDCIPALEQLLTNSERLRATKKRRVFHTPSCQKYFRYQSSLFRYQNGHDPATLGHRCFPRTSKTGWSSVGIPRKVLLFTLRYQQRLREATEKTSPLDSTAWLHKLRAREAKISLFRKKTQCTWVVCLAHNRALGEFSLSQPEATPFVSVTLLPCLSTLAPN